MWPAELCYSEATKNTPQAFDDMLSSAKSTLLQHWMPSSRFFSHKYSKSLTAKATV